MINDDQKIVESDCKENDRFYIIVIAILSSLLIIFYFKISGNVSK